MSTHRFKSEGPILYQKYQFGYCEWLESTTGNDLEEAYTGGFLPWSGDPQDPRHLFYMARSLRADMQSLSLDKKRRYDHREWQSFQLARKCLEKEKFLSEYGNGALQLAQTWMKQRFGDAYLQPDRLRYILGKPFLRHILTWSDQSRLKAFALVVREAWGAHYWYVFYDNDPSRPCPPGHGYMIDFLEWVGDQNLQYAYLGTAYGRKSLYKSRGITGVEFWDGNEWSADKGKLARFQEADAH
jgi:hypothetical protein